jgi:hypothetical protein
MDTLMQAFDERVKEIEAYLDLLNGLDRDLNRKSRSSKGPPMLGATAVGTLHQKILYSAVYLQLYNLVESTITKCVNAISEAAASKGGPWCAHDLSEELRREWVRHIARTHQPDITNDNRLKCALNLTTHLIQTRPIDQWEFDRTRAGRWDDKEIESISERLGVVLQIKKQVLQDIKRPVRDEKGPLALVKDLRNNLAHGLISFAECGDGVTVNDLRQVKLKTERYMRDVVWSYERYLSQYEFLVPEKRPLTHTRRKRAVSKP